MQIELLASTLFLSPLITPFVQSRAQTMTHAGKHMGDGKVSAENMRPEALMCDERFNFPFVVKYEVVLAD